MNTSALLRLSSLAALATVAVAASAQTALLPGGVVNPVPQNVAYPGDLGTIVAEMDQTPFTGLDTFGDVVFTGSLTSYVIRQADSTLAFGYYFDNDGTSMDSIERFNVAGFTGFTTAVEQGDATFGTTYPFASAASRTANGKVVSFSYGVGTTYGPIDPGVESRLVYVLTDATQYTTGSAQFIDGGVGSAATFVPQAVPEPSAFAALGLGAVGLLRRRKRA